VLGHSDYEHERLMIQSRLVRSSTDRFFRAAGLTEGMSVLDVGSGLGDVALLVADIAGSGGHVLGVERDAATAEKARRRVESEGYSGLVDIEIADLNDFDVETRFDALVGRYVLQYLPDPAAALRRLTRLVRPGGVIVFHDKDFSNANPTWPPCRLWDECYALMTRLFEAAGTPPDFGRRLTRTFLDAGLPWPTLEAVGPTGGAPGSALYPWLASCLLAVEPQLKQAGIGLPPGITIDRTLAGRLEKAVLEQGSQILGPIQYGAWTRMPTHAGPPTPPCFHVTLALGMEGPRQAAYGRREHRCRPE
jgi:ubiquinone/menaquinone biosynthesis C-methylase UbiE